MPSSLKPNPTLDPAIGLRGYYELPPPHNGWITVEVVDYKLLEGQVWFKVKQLLKGPSRWIPSKRFYRRMPERSGGNIVKTV